MGIVIGEMAKVLQKADIRFATKVFGKKNKFHFFESIGSSNSYALQLARGGADEGHVVWALHQPQGKGRLNKSWHDEPGQNLLISFLCRPQMDALNALKMTLGCACILRESILKAMPGQKTKLNKLAFKWPNDLVFGKRKVAGILVEGITKEQQLDYLVCGFGLNVNGLSEKMPAELGKKALSLREILATEQSVTDLAGSLVQTFEEYYLDWKKNGFDNVNALWLSHCAHPKAKIGVETKEGLIDAEFCGLDDNGFLKYKTDDGKISTLVSGEITGFY